MKIVYLPQFADDGSRLRNYACALLLPDPWTKTQRWPWMMAAHGMGERSDGYLAHLKNLVEGIDFDKNGTIDWVFAMESMKQAVDKYGIVIVIPTYQGFFDENKVNAIYNALVPEYSLANKFVYEGFSLAGGSVLNYAMSYANRLAYAVPVAPTRDFILTSLPAQQKLPIHIFVNDEDDNVHTNLSVTKSIINGFNNPINTGSMKPVLPAIYTAFRATGHGGHGEAVGITPPKAPGGQGFIDASENIYEVYLDILKNGPRQMKAGTVTAPPAPPKTDPTEVIALASFELKGNALKLIGSKSTGYKSGSEGAWELVSAPGGLKPWNVFPKGSTYIDADAVLTLPGEYVFKFILKGASAPLTVRIPYQAGKTVTGYDSVSGMVAYSDGTSERATAIYAGGKWGLTNAQGVPITL